MMLMPPRMMSARSDDRPGTFLRVSRSMARRRLKTLRTVWAVTA